MRVVVAQLNCLVGDVPGNVDAVLERAHLARDRHGAELVVFPELTLTGYPPEDLLSRSELIERVEAGVERLCRELRGVAVIVGYPKATVGGLFNVAGLIRDGALVVEYAKQSLPNYGVFDEQRWFKSGSTACVVEIGGHRIGLTVCEDVWDDAPVRQAAEAGADFVVNINASPFRLGKSALREELVARRARENGVGICYANLVGGQDELVFDGGSFVVDADGELKARARFFEERMLAFDLDASGAPSATDIEPRPDDDELAYRALVLGVRDYVHKNGFKGAVLGLSGGIDSALTAAIAVDALGADSVEVVLMPSRYTADMSVEDARLEAEALGIRSTMIPIEPAFQAFLGMLDERFANLDADVTEENIQARCRGILLMAISNKTGRILLTTGNKSEMAVGYATLYGDMAGGFAPLKDVYKLLVYRLSRWRNRSSPVIPERVITRPPSAELRPDQTDQDSLPPYEVLDAILARYIEQEQAIPDIVAAGFVDAEVRRVARLVDRNEYKRRQAPPGVRITSMAFGRDRRYPLTSGF